MIIVTCKPCLQSFKFLIIFYIIIGEIIACFVGEPEEETVRVDTHN